VPDQCSSFLTTWLASNCQSQTAQPCTQCRCLMTHQIPLLCMHLESMARHFLMAVCQHCFVPVAPLPTQ
jgi:hypothetical protein